MDRADLIIVGAGAAGLYAALCAARADARVVLISARPLAETASYWAQGGLAAALAPDDSPELHLQDTITAGRGIVRTSAARILTEEAPARFRDLEAIGVRFDADRHGNLALGLEGGHSRRRVAHAGGSATGRRILRELSAAVAEHPNIDVRESRRATGLRLSDDRATGLDTDDGRTLTARAVILATGGAAALWSRTTNPPGSFGSGLLLARAAGAALADLEFVQFHPTAVTGVPHREGFLVSEAVRGEGATLHDADGERFVDELAPRDAVARAIRKVMDATNQPHVHLDMRHVDPGRFPNVVEALREAGLDPMDRARPRLPRRPLRDGRHRHRPARPHRRGGPLRGRRVRLHRPPRRQPARLELAQRVLRPRRPRRRRGARRARTAQYARHDRPRRRHPARPRDPRGGLARRRAGARRRRPHAPPRRPAPARAARRGVSARAPGKPRRPSAQGFSG